MLEKDRMSHLDYYRYQTQARGVTDISHIQAIAEMRSHVYRRIVLPHLPKSDISSIVELGCGHGSFLFWLRQEGFKNLRGVDSSPEQIEKAKKTGCDVECADIIEWLNREPQASHDVIAGIDLIEHISKDQFMELIGQSFRVLRPGGRLILRYPNGDSPLVGLNLYNDITHVWTYTTNCVQTLSKIHGFSMAMFADESDQALRDNRWIKVPLSKLSAFVLRGLIRLATRENVHYLSPHIWAFLRS